MTRHSAFYFHLFVCLMTFVGQLANPRCLQADEVRPNVIFILCDDLGWRDVGCYGSTFHETPNIDKLSQRGVRLTQAYAASPLCSPTRSSILTGLYPARIGITAPACHVQQVQLEKKLQGASPNVKVLGAESLTRLKTDYVTLAERLKEAGYSTAHFGKWHLGHNLPSNPKDQYEPRDQGFDVDFPHTPRAAGPGGGYLAPWKFITNPAIVGEAGEHIESRMAKEAARYIREHKDRPFYLNYWAFSVHGPWNASAKDIEYFKKKIDPSNPQRNPLYAAMVHGLDVGVGHLLTAIDDAGIAERTIIVFFSDNGGFAYPPTATDPVGFADIPATSNLPLRSGKASLYEGGTREPCLIVWPGRIRPGTVSDALFHSIDFHPTLLTMCGLRAGSSVKLDGVDQTKTLLGAVPVRDRVFCHFPHGGGNQAESKPGFLPGTYVRKGDWKLIRFYGDGDDGRDRLELYNLKNDVGETQNLVDSNSKLVEELNALISDFLRETEAVVPIRNPNYSPGSKPATSPKKRQSQASRTTSSKETSSASTNEDDPALKGWKARNCSVTVNDGVASVKGLTANPFLGVGAGATGPATVTLRLRCPDGGEGRIEWIPSAAEMTKVRSVPYTVKGGDWNDVSVEVPAEGAIGILRVYVPAHKQVVNVDVIELKGANRQKRWDF